MASNEAFLSCYAQQIAEAWSDSILTVVCFAVGVLVFRRRSSGQRASSAAGAALRPRKNEPGLEEGLAAIPAELRGEVARALGLAGVGACAAAGHDLRKQFWDGPEAWRAFAGAGGAGAGQSTKAEELRDAFRRSHFRTDGERLRQLGGADGPQVMEEAALVIRGLVPADGAAPAEATCDAAVAALRARDPTEPASAVAAERLLEAAHRRSDVISAGQLGRLESAASSAVQLQVLMDQALEEHLEQLEAQTAAALDSMVDAAPISLPPLFWSNEPTEAADVEDEWVGGDQACDAILRELRASLRSV